MESAGSFILRGQIHFIIELVIYFLGTQNKFATNLLPTYHNPPPLIHRYHGFLAL